VKKLISLLTLMLGLSILLKISVFAESSYSWYCLRNRDHKQPKADTNMSFIEQYGGYYVDKKHGDDCNEKVIYLTFDAGYENGNVAKTLDILKEKETPGAFFVLGNLILREPELIKRMASEGHTVANHTTHHKDITKYQTKDELKQDLENLEALYRKATGAEMSKFFRPPEGKFNKSSIGFAKDLGYTTVFWSIAYADWDNEHQPSEKIAKAKILDHIHNGAIILLHPTAATNVKILGQLIDELKQQGYRFGKLTELTAHE